MARRLTKQEIRNIAATGRDGADSNVRCHIFEVKDTPIAPNRVEDDGTEVPISSEEIIARAKSVHSIYTDLRRDNPNATDAEITTHMLRRSKDARELFKFQPNVFSICTNPAAGIRNKDTGKTLLETLIDTKRAALDNHAKEAFHKTQMMKAVQLVSVRPVPESKTT